MDILAYIDALTDGRLPPSAFDGFTSALSFVERGGGVLSSVLVSPIAPWFCPVWCSLGALGFGPV